MSRRCSDFRSRAICSSSMTPHRKSTKHRSCASSLVELRDQDARVDEHSGPDAEACVGEDEARRHHPDAVLPVADLDRVPGVRADAPSRDDRGPVLVSDMRDYLPLSLVSKETADDDRTGHYPIIHRGAVRVINVYYDRKGPVRRARRDRRVRLNLTRRRSPPGRVPISAGATATDRPAPDAARTRGSGDDLARGGGALSRYDGCGSRRGTGIHRERRSS